MKSMVNKVQENFNKQQGAYNQQQSQDSQTAKKENPKPTKQIGDYVDYEEVE